MVKPQRQARCRRWVKAFWHQPGPQSGGQTLFRSRRWQFGQRAVLCPRQCELVATSRGFPWPASVLPRVLLLLQLQPFMISNVRQNASNVLTRVSTHRNVRPGRLTDDSFKIHSQELNRSKGTINGHIAKKELRTHWTVWWWLQPGWLSPT